MHPDPPLTLGFPDAQRWIALGPRHIDLLASPAVHATMRTWLSPGTAGRAAGTPPDRGSSRRCFATTPSAWCAGLETSRQALERQGIARPPFDDHAADRARRHALTMTLVNGDSADIGYAVVFASDLSASNPSGMTTLRTALVSQSRIF